MTTFFRDSPGPLTGGAVAHPRLPANNSDIPASVPLVLFMPSPTHETIGRSGRPLERAKKSPGPLARSRASSFRVYERLEAKLLRFAGLLVGVVGLLGLLGLLLLLRARVASGVA